MIEINLHKFRELILYKIDLETCVFLLYNMNERSFKIMEVQMSQQSEKLMYKFEATFEEMVPDPKVRKILINAIEVFARKGLSATKIKDIAEKAGFSQGFVYNYFKSKDEIFTKIADLAADGAGDSVKYAMELEGSPYERMFWLTEAFLSPESIAMEHWRLIMLQSTTSDAIPEDAKKLSKDKMRKPFEYLVPVIIEGQKLQQFIEEDPLMLAITYFSMIQGLGITMLQNGSNIPFPSVDLILKFIKK